ncbi:LysR family transcriptional regulator [Paraburkholderia sp. Ac-20342]|uniref:LysR family transcriptional regulator n=1 Tax=Paraburkholderia sp. Ac-20342 TaxID=2703889 RepID=UPI00197D6941|nr:LysR family transcriptional regulator [Paraburkholderia sp. Ac-20342]MBN3851369.1 LysR family transcriptional regulator [Paraburkholderia sp. Ac-20342]
MDVNLRDIRALVAVVEEGNFTRAAKRLHLSQPALTVQIRRLEEAICTRLLDRNSRNVALTPAGRELLPLLHRSLREMENVLRDARALGDGKSGTIRIACLPTFAASVLPELILETRRDVPRAEFLIRDVVAGMVNALVQSEEVDIGLTGGEILDPSLETLYTGVDRLVAVLPKSHPLAKKRLVDLKQLVQSPLVLMAPGTGVRAVVDAALGTLRNVTEVASEPTYMTTAVAMVRAGLGVTILPENSREVRTEPSLVIRHIDDAGFIRPLAIVKKRGRTLPPLTERFVEAMHQRLVTKDVDCSH